MRSKEPSIIAFLTFAHSVAFTPQLQHNRAARTTCRGKTQRQMVPAPAAAADKAHKERSETSSQAIRAPLKYIGPYPCLALRFPDLATGSQREHNITGVSLDFVLDTAANVNTIQQQVATALELEVIGQALPGVGAAGMIAPGSSTYMLGDSQLEGITIPEDEKQFTFMSELTASALPVANPGSAGLLSLAFLQVFHGGVEFCWGSEKKPASVAFYGDKSMDDMILMNRIKVPIKRVPVTQLPTVMLRVNGVDIPALLDTGSPITVLNEQAAKLSGVETTVAIGGSTNPFSAITNRFQEAQAASRGDVLMIAGVDGQRINLIKSKASAELEIGTASFGSSSLYVGDIPGLAALNGLGVQSPPAVVLGMDVLRKRPSMLLRAQDNEVWFE